MIKASTPWRNNTKLITTGAVLTALSVGLGILENMMPLTAYAFPGGKIGLSNIVLIVALSLFGLYFTLVMGIARIALCGFATTVSSLPFTFFGTVFSVLSMFAVMKLCKDKISTVGVSVVGAAVYNFTGVCVSAVIMSNVYMFTYLPPLLLISAATGAITGTVAGYCVRKIV